MNESFEHRPLLNRETLHSLQQRQDHLSLVRLALQFGAFVVCILAVIMTTTIPVLAFVFTVLLAAIWATLFAPFHECTHLTAFQSRHLNTFGAWLTGVPFGMAPAFYRAFHFQHHRYTHDPTRDPELGAPQLISWPTDTVSWLFLISGIWLLKLKVTALAKVSLRSTIQQSPIAPWASLEQGPRIVRETRVVALVWLLLFVAACLGVPGMAWLLAALVASHVFQALWLTTEHTGLPHEGSILARTRTMRTPAFVRWWLWNMNYHAEHHTWPAIPWYQLPAVHEYIAQHLEHVSDGYLRLQGDVLQQRNLPDGLRIQGTA